VLYVLGRGYVGVRTNTKQHSGNTPNKKVEIYHITVYVSGYNETDPTEMLSPNNCRQSGDNKVGLFRPDGLARHFLQFS
jgi:hypothetical protein